VIYLGLSVYVVYQALPSQRYNGTLAKINKLFLMNCLANSAWIFAWHYDSLFLSLLMMAVILATLIGIYVSLGRDEDGMSSGRQWFVDLPFSLYTGWITVAAIANISVVQTAMDWDSIALNAVDWTLLKLSIAGAVGAIVTLRRRDIAFILVIGWAALGISVGQAATPAVSGAAMTLAILALLLALFEAARKLARSCYKSGCAAQ
jgi:hypothetical protein